MEGSLVDRVHGYLLEWADWSRRDGINIGYPSQTTIARVMREGAGASVAPAQRAIDMPETVQRVELAVRSLPERELEAIKLKYLKVNITDRQRAKRMHMSYSQFRNTLDHARWYLCGCLR